VADEILTAKTAKGVLSEDAHHAHGRAQPRRRHHGRGHFAAALPGIGVHARAAVAHRHTVDVDQAVDAGRADTDDIHEGDSGMG
jgi:hypothetical protein